jgi:hypothetical protein
MKIELKETWMRENNFIGRLISIARVSNFTNEEKKRKERKTSGGFACAQIKSNLFNLESSIYHTKKREKK